MTEVSVDYFDSDEKKKVIGQEYYPLPRTAINPNKIASKTTGAKVVGMSRDNQYLSFFLS